MLKHFRFSSIDNDASLALKMAWFSFVDRFNIARKSARYGQTFAPLKTFCTFIGYPRSGHSIISSFIDAHPNALMAHRLDALKYVEAGHTPREVFYLILKNSQRFAKSGRMLTAYKYNIPNQSQGVFETLTVIGDQEGKWTSIRLGANPKRLNQFLETTQITPKIIHVIRNPYDNITTWALRMFKPLEPIIEAYFSLCENVATVKKHLNSEMMLDIHHEPFLNSPETTITTVCNFLGLPVNDTYVADCKQIVYQSPHKSRYKKDWPPHLIETVALKMSQFDFLQGYSFKD